MRQYPGAYRGVVVRTDDPQKRGRYKIRVVGVHIDTTPEEGIPWAEHSVPFSSQFAGDIPKLQEGDRVFVMFEGGDSAYPIVIGGWAGSSSGILDTPSSIAQDYTKGQQRWIRCDRVGNALEMSEVSDEMSVKLRSGASEVSVSQLSGEILLSSTNSITEKSGSHNIQCKIYTLDASSILINAAAYDTIGGVAGVLSLMSNLHVIMHAEGDLLNTGKIDIGGYTPKFLGVAVPPAKQTDYNRLRAKFIDVGTAVADIESTLQPVPLPETHEVDISGAVVAISSKVPVVNVPFADIPRVTIDSVGNVSITSLTKVSVSAPLIEATATVKASVTAPEVDVTSPLINVGSSTTPGVVNVNAINANVTATGAVNVNAPSINLTASASVTMTAPVLTFTGILNFIGATTVTGPFIATTVVQTTPPQTLSGHTHPSNGAPPTPGT